MSRGAITFYSSNYFWLARQACSRSLTEPRETLTAVAWSAFALEAFLGDFRALAEMDAHVLGSGPASQVADRLADSPRKPISAAKKISILREIFDAAALEETTPIVGDVLLLFRIRNALVHLHAEHHRWDPAEEPFEPAPHELVAALVKLGVLVNPPPRGASPWVDQILQVPVAVWAYNAAARMAHAIIDATPPSTLRMKATFLHEFVPLLEAVRQDPGMQEDR